AAKHGYATGNVVNLLRLIDGDLRGLDASGLLIRQAYLQDVPLYDANLSGSELVESALAEAFEFPVPVALSADAGKVAVGTAGGEMRVWRTADRTPILSVAAHTGVVMALAWNRENTLLASTGHDGSVKLWDAETGDLLKVVDGHASGGWCVALAPNGR